jgi:NADP-dependent 3-hydroxy acid dehydrogenase YdfG
MSEIKDKVIAITGASRGIGEATAMLLAERGASVVLMALPSDHLPAVAARIADAGRWRERTRPAKEETRRPLRDEVVPLRDRREASSRL